MLDALAEFLIKAKAALVEDEKTLSEFRFSEGNFSYLRRSLGNLQFQGTEIVWYEERPIWGMQYCGSMLPDFHNESEEAYAFLREALQQVPTRFPIRGPPQYKRKEWLYIHVFTHDLESFTGNERIRKNDQDIYNLTHQGGLLK